MTRQGTFTAGQGETAVVVGAKRALDLSNRPDSGASMTVVGSAEMADYLRQGQPVVLTDDYAPVEQLTAHLFLERERPYEGAPAP